MSIDEIQHDFIDACAVAIADSTRA